MEDAWTGLVLAGGESLRFGSDKARALLAGRSLLEWSLRALAPGVDRLIVATGTLERREILADAVGCLEALPSLQWVPDLFPRHGPLGGLASGMQAAPHGWCLVLSCDCPLISSATLQLLKARALESGADAVIPWVQGRPQPLVAAWSTRLITIILEQIRGGHLKIVELMAKIQVECVLEAEIYAAGGTAEEFLNLNVSGALADAERLLRNRTPAGESPCGAVQ